MVRISFKRLSLQIGLFVITLRVFRFVACELSLHVIADARAFTERFEAIAPTDPRGRGLVAAPPRKLNPGNFSPSHLQLLTKRIRAA